MGEELAPFVKCGSSANSEREEKTSTPAPRLACGEAGPRGAVFLENVAGRTGGKGACGSSASCELAAVAL